MTQEQEIRAKALEIAATFLDLPGNAFKLADLFAQYIENGDPQIMIPAELFDDDDQ